MIVLGSYGTSDDHRNSSVYSFCVGVFRDNSRYTLDIECFTFNYIDKQSIRRPYFSISGARKGVARVFGKGGGGGGRYLERSNR